MKCVDRMLEEHRLIERMLRVLEESARGMERGGTLPEGMLEGIVEFLQVYADAGHHAKEESLFFPALADRGLESNASAVSALQAQHENGRGLVRELCKTLPGARRGDKSSCEAFAATASDYIGLLREHIRLEDYYFPDYASTCLTPADDEALLARMDAEDRAQGIDGARFERMVADYEEALLKC